ncbi:hypothetical protein [Nocardia gipuzkoensis]
MSTAIKVKKGAEPIDEDAERWLSATELADNEMAAMLLSRAIHPARYGFSTREPLTLPEADSDSGAKVVWLLKAEQTPTPDAVEAAILPEPGGVSKKSAKKLAKQKAWHEQNQRAKNAIANTNLGELLADAVAAHRLEHGIGPLWSEVLTHPEVAQCWTNETGMRYVGTAFRNPIFQKAQKAGWVAFNTQERSLCTGRRFHRRSFGDKVSQARPEDVGFLTAAFISAYLNATGQSPEWAQVAAAATDQHGVPLFFDADDAAAQYPWLATHGWVYQRGETLHWGKRAEAEAERRTRISSTPKP